MSWLRGDQSLSGDHVVAGRWSYSVVVIVWRLTDGRVVLCVDHMVTKLVSCGLVVVVMAAMWSVW